MATNDPLGGLGELLGGLTSGDTAGGTAALPSGLGDAIGSLLGGAGAGAAPGAGGLEDLVKGFQQAGLEDEVQSWIGGGPNKPVTAEQIGRALGPERVQQLAGSSGIDAAQLLPLLAAFLPQIINALTPKGRLPTPGDATTGSGNPLDALNDVLKGLGG